jgi:hypothetical protein
MTQELLMILPPKTLSIQIWGWRFRVQLDEIRRAYQAAREASEWERKRIENEWKQLEVDEAAGRASITMEDEDGQVVYDRGEHVGEMLSEIEGALRIYREAFAIALYHFWERQITARMKVARYHDADVFEYLKNNGIEANEAELTVLRLAANVAKHSEGRSAEELYSLRPDLFDTAEMAKWKDPPGHEHLQITDDVLDAFFRAVRKSGPPR